ncbi:MAG: hypothetical protein IPM37_13610 [Hahellaceae bacterium]|nr:hypothetical protein [Hahellaceae bacterium]
MRPPAGSDVIEEWEFFYALAKRMDLVLGLYPAPVSALAMEREAKSPVMIDMSIKPSSDEIWELLCEGSRIPLGRVKQHPEGAIFRGEDSDGVVAPKDENCRALLEIGNDEVLRELATIRARTPIAVRYNDYPYLLISRRSSKAFNSTAREFYKMGRGQPGNYNPAFMHPEDVSALGLVSGNMIEITSRHAHIFAVVEADETLRRGLVSMTHAYGGLPSENQDIRKKW